MTHTLAIDIDGNIENTIDMAVNIGLKLLALVAIMLIGWFVARLLRGLVHRLLHRVGFNRLVENSGLRRISGQQLPSQLLAKIVYYVVLLFTLQLAFSVFGPNPVSDMIRSVVAWLPKLFFACVIIVVAVAIANAVFDLVSSALGSLSYGRALARIAQVAIIALGAIAAVNQIGVATTVTLPVLITVLATIGGIAVVGVGGGLIQPMRQRWERALTRAEAESGRLAATVREHAAANSNRGFTQPAYQGMDTTRDLQRPVEEPAPTRPAHAAEPGPGSAL
jgi:ABC-type dipeptide/oligopeptide/nickel transport system permease component